MPNYLKLAREAREAEAYTRQTFFALCDAIEAQAAQIEIANARINYCETQIDSTRAENAKLRALECPCGMYDIDEMLRRHEKETK